jgi:hypothetical protein
MEFKVVVCAVAGIVVWLELQRGKSPMRELEFARESGVTAGCTLRGCRDAKRFSPDANDDSTSDDDPHKVFFGDAWFSSVEVVCQGWRNFQIRHAGVVKTAHSCFPKAWLEEAMKEHPSGAHLVLEGKATEGVDLIAVGCKCNSRKVICFICHRNAGSTKFTGFYEAKWKDENNNAQTRRVPRPDIIDRCFRKSNLVDSHNQARQSDLRLEKHWVTQTGHF